VSVRWQPKSLKARTEAFVIGSGSRPESKACSEKMGADLVLDHSGDIVEQLSSAGIPSLDLVLSTAKTAEQIGWIARVLRPFGHLSVVDAGASLDVSPLMIEGGVDPPGDGLQQDHERQPPGEARQHPGDRCLSR
jgi:D-arabinose 1-dehydrogenase-like Zn-dependent alcohol dehydrogenase